MLVKLRKLFVSVWASNLPIYILQSRESTEQLVQNLGNYGLKTS